MTSVTVLIGSPLEAEYAGMIRQVDPRVELIYRPDLLGRPRYHADHSTLPNRTPEQEAEWRGLVARAEVMFDFDPTHMEDLLQLAPRLRWVQSTSSGIGWSLIQHGLHASDLIVTNAAGIHVVPLTEFCLMAMLMWVKRLGLTIQMQAERRWERFHGTTLRGKTLGIIGLGAIGKELGRSSRALGMSVEGVKATLPMDMPAEEFHVDRIRSIDQLRQLLPGLDFVVACLPLTPRTRMLIGAEEFALMRPSAYFVNIGRGATVDEDALIRAIEEQRIAGVALDVVAREPLDPASPLWTLPNVLISPHSASTVDTENRLLTELFCDNLGRYLDGRPLRNVVDKQRGY